MNLLWVKEMLAEFLKEDIGFGDASVEGIFGPEDISTGKFILKEDGVVCGLFLAPMVYDLLGGETTFKPLVEEGKVYSKGTILAEVKGPVGILLSGERLILNLWQRLSGIATATKKAVDTLADPTIRIVDTRKTAPGLRIFDKYAVTKGGGFNHRFGLDDGIMLKDNHLAYAGGITAALKKVRASHGHMIKVEVEIETLEQFQEAVREKVDVIMLDNRTPEEIKNFLTYNEGIITEASGGITLENLASFKNCGVDYLSLGYLTHSVKALDISFNSEKIIKG